MLKIYPITNYKNYYKNNGQNPAQNPYVNCPKTDEVSFKGCFPSSSRNRNYINKIVQLLKSKEVKKPVIIVHAAPDEDAIGSALAFKQMLKTIGKKAEIFVMHPLAENIKFIDPEGEIKILCPNPEFRITADEIALKHHGYDTAICIDTSDKKLFNPELFEAFVKDAKHKIKIDHHPDERIPSYHYADINFIDSTKESASQIIMEFASAFGLNTKKLDKKISDPLTLGIMGDSGELRFARGENIFKDLGILSRSTKIRDITDKMNEITPNEFNSFRHILGKNITLRDDGIAYAIIDVAKEVRPIKKTKHEVLDIMSRVKGVKYYFTILTNSQDPKWKKSVQVRSSEKSIKQKITELGGGGHALACGLDDKQGRSIKNLTNLIIKTLQDVENS